MTDQPNIVFIMPDQLRADFLSCYGADFHRARPTSTAWPPKASATQRTYSASPICVPARASLLTGLNAIRNGVLDNGQWLRPDLAAVRHPAPGPNASTRRATTPPASARCTSTRGTSTTASSIASIAEDKRWLHIRDDYYHFLRSHGHRKYHGNEHEGYFENKRRHRQPSALGALGRSLRGPGGRAASSTPTAANGPFAMMVGFPGPHCPYDPEPGIPGPGRSRRHAARHPRSARRHAAYCGKSNIDGNQLPWNGVDYTEFTDDHKRKIRAHYAASVLQIDYEVGQILDSLRSSRT